jgi:hypothetical protein
MMFSNSKKSLGGNDRLINGKRSNPSDNELGNNSGSNILNLGQVYHNSDMAWKNANYPTRNGQTIETMTTVGQ